jgi:hypothetical protein
MKEISPSNYGEGYFDTTTQYMQPGDFFVRTGSGEEIEISSIEPQEYGTVPLELHMLMGRQKH